ncbi:MAG: hypothetical protein AAF654_12455 [Myxococcota bacterium]
MSRVEGGRAAEPQRAEQGTSGAPPPGAESAKAAVPGVTKGQPAIGPDGKPLTLDGMTGEAQVKAPAVAVTDQGLQTQHGNNPFDSLDLARAQQMGPDGLRLTGTPVDMDVELELPAEVLGKLLGLEKRAAQPDGTFSLHPKLGQAGERLREGSMLLVSDASAVSGDGEGDASGAVVRDTKTVIAGKVLEFVAEARLANAKHMKNAMFAQRSAFPMGMDVHAFVKAVLREAYMLQNEELLDRGRKMKELNERKKQLRANQRRAEELKHRVLSGDASAEDLQELAFILGVKVNTQKLVPPVEGDESGEGVDPVEAGGDTPPVDDVGGDTPPESGDEPGLNEASVAFLATLRESFPSDPFELFGKLAGWLGTGQAMNGFQILHFGDLKDDPGRITRAMGAASALTPDKYLQMLRGLLFLQKNVGRINKLDKEWDHDWDTKAEEFFKQHKGHLNHWIETLIGNGTPIQLAGLEKLDPDLRGILDEVGAGSGFDFGRMLEQAKIDVGNNLQEPGTALHRLHDLFHAWQVAPGGGSGFMDALRHELRSGRIEDALQFFADVGGGLIESGQIDVLQTLMGSVSRARLEANADKLEWLDGHDLSGAEAVAATPTKRPPSPEHDPMPRPDESSRIEGADPRDDRSSGGSFRTPIESGRETHARLTADPSSTSVTLPPAMGGSTASSEGETLATYEWQHEIEGPVTGRPAFEDDVLYLHLMTEDEAEAFLSRELKELEDESASIGFDQQMMQMELQDLLQKQQQFLTMMSNMSKMMHDVAMSIIRNIGG